MLISATGTSTSKPLPGLGRAGFTLLELLVVVVIIAVMASTVMFSVGLGGEQRALEREALRFEGLVALLREEALMQNRDYGIEFTRDSYRFFVFDALQNAWFPPPDDRILVQYTLPDNFELGLILDDRDLGLPSTFEEDTDEDAFPEPQLLILATGELTPFRLQLFRDFNAGQVSLAGTLDGKMEMVSEGFN